ncbi:hypothetical protein Dpo_4c03540 [Desulfotignum phosphitoxidans DSM 13687]|uniref:Uncharacterized protein n=1 Tax=Desulfotignum phosphitoxidans DSM 13687 TaxID=1286635 RepID=S0G5K9_9BACT|nr:hypothetical protein Dpo_4c03540 [Desulfotignum phosphitoxidans DSM 13687]
MVLDTNCADKDILTDSSVHQFQNHFHILRLVGAQIDDYIPSPVRQIVPNGERIRTIAVYFVDLRQIQRNITTVEGVNLTFFFLHQPINQSPSRKITAPQDQDIPAQWSPQTSLCRSMSDEILL